jgi:hypothetical protein
MRRIVMMLAIWTAAPAQASVLNFTGFETGNAAELSALTGTASINSLTKRTGGYGLLVNPTTTGIGYARITQHSAAGNFTNFDNADLYARFYFYGATLPSSDSEEFFCFTNAGTYKLSGRVHSDGSVSLWDTSGSQLAATAAGKITAGPWYRIEVRCGTGDSASYELKIDGISELSGTGDLFTSNSQYVRLGKFTNRNSQTVGFYYDDVAISDSAYPGAGQVEMMLPDGAGNYTAFTGTYTDVDDVPHDSDTSYLTSATSGDAETVALESAATAGISGTINIVKAVAIVRDEGGSSAIQLRLRSGTTDTDTTNNDPGSTYAARCRIFETDPADSSAWTTAKLDALEVGIENNANVAIRCTASYVMVDFTPAGGSTMPVFLHHLRQQGVQ